MVEDSNIDEENKQPKKESDLVKFLKKRSFIYLACAVVFVVFFVPEMLQPDDLEKIHTSGIDLLALINDSAILNVPAI